MIIPMPHLEISRRSPGAPAIAAVEPIVRLWREAKALSLEGKHAEAVKAWRTVVAAMPRDPEAACELGRALAAGGQHGEAIESFERALRQAPGDVQIKLALGRALLSAGRTGDARRTFENVLADHSDNADALVGRAACLRQEGDAAAALTMAERAHTCAPDHTEAALEMARALADLKREDEAIGVLQKLCIREPDHVEAAQALGRHLQAAKRFNEAADHLRRVVDKRPDDAFAWQDLACALRGAYRYEEGLQAFRRALALKPAFPVAFSNQAMLLNDLGRSAEAVHSIDQALAMEPDSKSARFVKGCIHLTRGEFGPGWDGYEFRFSKDNNKGAREDVRAAPWCGEPLAGRSILVLGEQASGDYIQFASNLSVLVQLGAKVSLFVPRRLKRLLSSIPGIEVRDNLNSDPYDFQIHLMSLPHRLLRLGYGVQTSPWLRAEPELVDKWRQRIGTEGFRIGVVWRGSNNDYRSYGAAQLAVLGAMPGVRLISLHMDDTRPEGLPPGMVIEQLGTDYDAGDDGFVDTAAVMASLDLVVSCDTSLAHLAGALGRPLWVVLAHAPEWRWQRHTSDSVWYPTARLFRQPTPNDWDSVFSEVAEALRTRLGAANS